MMLTARLILPSRVEFDPPAEPPVLPAKAAILGFPSRIGVLDSGPTPTMIGDRCPIGWCFTEAVDEAGLGMKGSCQ
jgi:hypothetical protein